MSTKSTINKATILDFYDHMKVGKHAELLKPLIKEIPDFVIEMDKVAISEQASQDDYAIIINGEPKFPIDSRPNTWLSKIAFDKTKDKLLPTARDITAYFIKKAAASYGLNFPDLIPKRAHSSNIYHGEENILEIIQEDVEKQAVVQQQELDKSFAVELNGRKMFPINSKEQVSHAKEAFDKDYKKLPYNKRHEMAQSIFEKCAEFEIGLKDSYIAKYAGNNFSIFLPLQIKTRKKLLNKKAAGFLQSLYDKKHIWGPSKFAMVLYTFDKEAGLIKHYNLAISDAFISVFSDPSVEKLAFTFDTKYGKVTENILNKIAQEQEKIAKFFGEEFAAEFKSSPVSTFNTLNNSEKNVVIDIIRTEKIL